MTKRAAVLVITVLLLLPNAPAGGAGGSKRDVSIYIGKNARRVNVFGWIVPAASNRKIVVKVFKLTLNGRRLIAKKRIRGRRDERPPYGSRRGTYYSTRLPRPRSGDCRAVVRVRRGPKGVNDFPCTTPDFGTGTAVLTGEGTTTIDVLTAEDSSEWGYGLMYRRRLGRDKGMAFLFPSDRTGGFYMKNTVLPLSIAFVDSSNVVVALFDMDPCWVEPCEVYTPGDSYRTALEVNQGAFDRWGIGVGDRITVTP